MSFRRALLAGPSRITLQVATSGGKVWIARPAPQAKPS